MLTAGVDVQLTEKYLVISDPLRRLEIAAEWFRVAYRMNKDPRQNPHLYRQLAEMKRQIEALETELQGDGPVKRNWGSTIIRTKTYAKPVFEWNWPRFSLWT